MRRKVERAVTRPPYRKRALPSPRVGDSPGAGTLPNLSGWNGRIERGERPRGEPIEIQCGSDKTIQHVLGWLVPKLCVRPALFGVAPGFTATLTVVLLLACGCVEAPSADLSFFSRLVTDLISMCNWLAYIIL